MSQLLMFQEYSVTFSSYFNVLWKEPRLHISDQFLLDLNISQEGGYTDDTMIPGKQIGGITTLANNYTHYLDL